ncbi:MAG: type II secretion system F family protein [Acidimicrobiales bacterium]|nr:type II secretion system F family protein [Acidimicrobiales bacterium]
MTIAVLGSFSVVAVAAGWTLAQRWVGRMRASARIGLEPHGQARAPAPIVRWLADAGIEGDPGVLFRGWIMALAAGCVVAALVPAGAFVLGIVALGPAVGLVAGRGRADRRRAAQLPSALDAMAASVRGGSALRVALHDAATVGPPLGPELSELARRADAGMGLAEVVGAWTDELDHGAARLAGASIVVAATLGGPGADALESAATSLREQADVEREAAALAVQARLSAAVLTAAPVVFALLLTSVDPTAARFLLTTPVGWICVAGGCALDAAGAAWMARIVRGAR